MAPGRERAKERGDYKLPPTLQLKQGKHVRLKEQKGEIGRVSVRLSKWWWAYKNVRQDRGSVLL